MSDLDEDALVHDLDFGRTLADVSYGGATMPDYVILDTSGDEGRVAVNTSMVRRLTEADHEGRYTRIVFAHDDHLVVEGSLEAVIEKLRASHIA